MEQEVVEHLIKCAEKVARYEEKYYAAKMEYDLLKADYILLNDWEKVLGKKKPTQKEKDSYIEKETAIKKAAVNEAKVKMDYVRRIYELNVLNQKIR